MWYIFSVPLRVAFAPACPTLEPFVTPWRGLVRHDLGDPRGAWTWWALAFAFDCVFLADVVLTVRTARELTYEREAEQGRHAPGCDHVHGVQLGTHDEVLQFNRAHWLDARYPRQRARGPSEERERRRHRRALHEHHYTSEWAPLLHAYARARYFYGPFTRFRGALFTHWELR